MKILATLPTKGRDLRLDLFRGVANWGIFLDHIPNNIVNWLTTRNYGFSDAADLFIFIFGYTVSFVFARMMLERGFIIGATRLLKRVWQIYVAHVFLFVLYLAEIGYIAQRSGNAGFTDDFNIRGFLENPAQFLFEGLILRFKPVSGVRERVAGKLGRANQVNRIALWFKKEFDGFENMLLIVRG